MKSRTLSAVVSILCFFVFFAGTIDLTSLFNYSNQAIPSYINRDNTPNANPITDAGATLGRVLFYDKNLSLTNTISCSSCHKQALAFGDSAVVSPGHDGGVTGRHSMRLSSLRFGQERDFFWDERANSLEEQSTMPIQDHVEMGFSGMDGNPSIDSLINKLGNIEYYADLFNLAYGDESITERRIQNALAQFIRSMQSFDSKYDVGRAQVGNNNARFPNFTAQENRGKALFMNDNATMCNECHRAPEFDILPNSGNNGVIGVAGSPGSIDLTNERSPSLRDIVNSEGVENGPYMHDGSLSTLMDVINHYDDIPLNPNNTNLDNRLRRRPNLNLSNQEKEDLLAFLKTLGGTDLYVNEKWSDPFDNEGSMQIIGGTLPVILTHFEVTQDDNTVVLDWATSTEVNNEGFEIWHSLNTVDWTVLDFVISENRGADYRYIHVDPIAAFHYYKLKQVDFDGQFTFSDTRSVSTEKEANAIQVFPNPTVDFVRITAPAKYSVATVYNSSGRTMYQKEINTTTSIDLSQFKSGTYIIALTSATSNQKEVRRVVKI